MGSGVDDSERWNAQLDVLRFVGESTDDYLFLCDFQTGRLYLTGDIAQRFSIMEDGKGYCTLEDWYGIVYEKDLPALEEDLNRIRLGRQTEHNAEYRLADRHGKRIWISCRGRCQTNGDHPPIMVGRVSDTTFDHAVDSLTGTFNSTKLLEDIGTILHEEASCYLLILGIDNLRKINIRHGREYGNQILREVADALEQLCEANLRIYRLNGDCFAVNLPDSDQEDVQRLYDILRKRLHGRCTLSAGAVAYRSHRNDDSTLLYGYAEEALDKAKRSGKDTLMFFSQKDYEEKLLSIELQDELAQSIQNGFEGFSLQYQPQIRSGSYRLFGAEALLRYTSPSRGPVSPTEFIPLLEQNGMICQVGKWVLETALAQCRAWRAFFPEFHISVNISYTQLSQQDVVKQVLHALKQSDLPGDALTLEVTESMQLQDYPRFNRLFYQWKEAGVEISVDDFGTGYSSLGYLKSLDIDEIKIDRCFVSGIQHSAYNFRLLSNIVELARSSQIRICCEGVETAEELAALEQLHPDLLQGFLFSPPCTQDGFESLCARWAEMGSALPPELSAELDLWSLDQLPEEMGPTAETMSSIVEALDDIVYISDPNTYEIYYLNSIGCRLTGAYDYQGQKCYKVLQGRDDPCAFCTNHLLKKDSFYIWERDNKLMNRHFLLKDKLVLWRGKWARMEVAVDVSEHEIVTQHTREQLDYAQNALGCARVLAEEPDMDYATQRMLELVGNFYQADRAYFFEPDPSTESTWSNTFEWCREGVSAQRDNLQGLTRGLIQRWLDIFDRDESVIIANLEDLCESSPNEYEVLFRQGIRRLIAVPVHRDGRPTSFLGVDNPRHCIGDDALIRMLVLFLTYRFRHEETEERLGELLDLHYRDVLKATNLGLWFIRIPSDDDAPREMFADETMRKVLGLTQRGTPRACYKHWYSRINDGYYQYVNLGLESMIRSRKVVQLEYPWNHPTLGEVMIRCTGIRGEDSDGTICLEGYHRIISEVEQPQFLPDTPIGEVLEFNERKGSVYFHTKRTLLDGSANHIDDFPQCWLDEGMVHPHFTDRFRAIFHDVRNAPQVEGEEFLLRAKSGDYEWFKLRTRRLGDEDQDRDTILVLLDAADQERRLELENMRLKDFYHASLSEAIAYAEVDLECQKITAAGGLWNGYENSYPERSESILQFMSDQACSIVRVEDDGHFQTIEDNWKGLLSTAQGTWRYQYQRIVDDQWRWVEIVAHTFRDQFSSAVYALLYLKDIDRQKHRELAQEEEARRDPLTRVYNRTAFQSEVERHMNCPGGSQKGVLMILDIDDFKSINDHFGHLEGDAALRCVTTVLQSTFRSRDIIGRMGGDEFLVFLVDVPPKATLDQRVCSLLESLRLGEHPVFTCSIGITYVHNEGFSYQNAIRQADAALYHSKKNGKNMASYYSDLPSEEKS